MLHALVFDTKIIHYERECDGAGHMLPEAGGMGHFKVPMLDQPLLEKKITEILKVRSVGEARSAPL